MVAMDRTTEIQGFGAALPALSCLCQQHSQQGERHGTRRSQPGALLPLRSASSCSFERGSRRICRRLQHCRRRDICRSSSARADRASGLSGAEAALISARRWSANERVGNTRQRSPCESVPKSTTRCCSVFRLGGGSRRATSNGASTAWRTRSAVSADLPRPAGQISNSAGPVRTSVQPGERETAMGLMAQAPSTGTMRSASGSTMATPGASKMSGRSSLRETCPPLCSSSLRASAPSKRVRLLKAFRK